MRRAGESSVDGFGIACRVEVADVVRVIFPDCRRFGRDSVRTSSDGSQGFIVDSDCLRRILSLGQRLRNDKYHIVADHADLIGHQWKVGWVIERCAVWPLHSHVAGDGTEPVGTPVGSREDGENARHRCRGGRVDAADPCVCMWRTQNESVGCVWQIKIIHETSAAFEETRVFEPRDALADGKPFNHGNSNPSRAGRHRRSQACHRQLRFVLQRPPPTRGCRAR